jgi:hypothetical protein
MSEDSKKPEDAKKPEQKKWKIDSVDGALLFILFVDKIYHPDSYSATEIFDNPKLPFKDYYSRKNFGTYCQTAANRAKSYNPEKGTGIPKIFKGFVIDARKEFKELLENLKKRSDSEEVEEEEEEVYQEEEDEDFVDPDDLSLNDLLQDPKLDSRFADQEAMPAAKTTENSKSEKKPSAKTTGTGLLTLDDPYIIPYPGNEKAYVQFAMDGNVDDDDSFKVEVLPNSIRFWKCIPSQYENASELLGKELCLSQDRKNCLHCIVILPRFITFVELVN